MFGSKAQKRFQESLVMNYEVTTYACGNCRRSIVHKEDVIKYLYGENGEVIAVVANINDVVI